MFIQFFKHETPDQQQYVLQSDQLRLTLIQNRSFISLAKLCAKAKDKPLPSVMLEAGFEPSSGQEFWRHYDQYHQVLFMHSPYEQILLDHLAQR